MIGQTLSHYRILEKLGEGGMGVVYKAEDTKLKRIVALKLLPAHLTEHKDRFLREAQAAAALNHPNICTIHEIDELHPFIAMEFLDGITLKDKISHRPLPLAEALDIAIQTCQGLQHAHENGVVHRDIKPANIMVTPTGQVKIMDFGLAQIGDRTRMTKTGSSLGTPAYMSPEQVKGEPADRRTDIWALGVTLYEMLTGRLPFPGDTEQAVSFGIVHTNPEPPTALRTGLPLELDRILAKALAKNPDQRYQNISDLSVDLKSVSTSGSLKPASKTRWPLALAALLIVAAAGYFSWRATSKTPAIHSIAIIPLRTLTQEASASFLGLGIADALITKIGQFGQLQVRPIGAVRKFATGDRDPLDVARNLNADAVLDGSIQQSASRLRVSVHLLNVASGETLWTQSFDIDTGEVFAMQDSIALQIATQLRLKLDPAQRRDLEKRATSNPAAFELYSKALFHFDHRLGNANKEMGTVIELLKSAIELYAFGHPQSCQ